MLAVAITGLLAVSVVQAAGVFQDRQTRPILLGTSGGNINAFSGLFCSSGTLGALVQKGGSQYILSNNHVLARENKAKIGDDITQPGLIDTSPVCQKEPLDVVADVTAFVTLQFGKRTTAADAAITLVGSGQVNADGAILALGADGSPGTVSNIVSSDTLGCAVQKSGRTTGHTTGSISAVDATVIVKYSGGRATFTNQFFVTPSSFSAGGDSGSLIVRDGGPNPRPVGLLFAGNGTSTIANPIQDVLTALGVSMVGSDDGNTSGDCPPASQATQTAVATGRAAKAKHVDALMNLPEVVGVAVGADGADGAVEVYLERDNASTRQQVPAALDGVPVRVQVTGAFEAR